MADEFSVFQFFLGGDYEKVVEWVGAEEAMRTVVSLVNSVGCKVGTTEQVIITDGLDFTTFVWEFGKGVTWPPKPSWNRDRDID